MHWERRYRVIEIKDLRELCRYLCRERFNLCTGFRYGSLTLLNDSASVDGHQEYAVVKDERQVESFTVSFMDEETLANRLDLLDTMGTDVDLGLVAQLEHGPGKCEHCG